MNKKISTLLTFGLLMAGSLVSVANAQTELTLPIGDAVSTFKSGAKYFVVQDTDGTLDGTNSFALGFAKDATAPNTVVDASTKLQETAVSSGIFAKTTTKTADIAELETNSYIWAIKETKVGAKYYYTFTNASTGKVLTINGAIDAEALVKDFTTPPAQATTSFTFGAPATAAAYTSGTVLTYANASADAKGFTLTEGKTDFGTGGKFYLYEVAPTPVEASGLNDAAKGAFTLKYDKSTNNPFSGSLRAFKVEASNISEVVDGTYFATSWPASLNGKDAIAELADFKKCTFIAANPQSNYKINDLNIDGGEGFGFINVKGSMLVTTPDLTEMKKGYILSNNAAFAVDQEYGNTKDYQLSLTGASFISKDGKAVKTIAGELIIAALNDQQGKYVTTVLESNANFDSYTSTSTIDAANLITVDKLLSTDKASVFNIKFLSKNAGDKTTTESEYNKYLGVNGATEVFFAQGANFVNLDAPENQWVIVGADKDNNSFTFQNRDLVDQTFDVQLVKTDKENVYEVITASKTFGYAWVDKDTKKYETDNDGELNGTTIELTAVTVDPAAGFVTDQLDDAGLIKFVATSDQKLIVDKLYLGAGEAAPLEMRKEAAASYLWTIVKSEVDPYESYNDYAYYNATDKKVETKLNGDTIKVSLFSFKQYGVGATYLTVNSSGLLEVAEGDNSEDAQQFLIKANKNGTYSLIEVEGAATDYRDVVADEATKTFSVNSADATVANVDASPFAAISAFYDYEQTYILTIEKEELTPSLKHEPNYVALNASNRGYVAMDSILFEGIVAPVSSLKSTYTAEELTFRLDTVDTDALVPAFYISHKGNFMYNAKDSAAYYNDGTASAEGNRNYLLKDSKIEYVKAIFRTAKLVASDTLATTVGGKDAAVTVNKTKETLGGLNNFKFNIVQQTKDSEGDYVVKSVNDGLFLFNLNGFLGFTADPAKALVVNVEQSESPVANEAVTTSSIKVIAGNGAVTVIGAAGKKVTISNVLGQTIANAVLSSDNATIAAPAGLVFVAVEGEAAVKAIVK